MMKPSKLLGVLALLVVAGYLLMNAPTAPSKAAGPANTPGFQLPTPNQGVSVEEVNGYWAKIGLDWQTINFSTASLQALSAVQLDGLKSQFGVAAAKGGAGGDLAKVYVSLVGLALTEKLFNAFVDQSQALPYADYCANLSLFRDMDAAGAKRVEELNDYVDKYTAFLAIRPDESQALGMRTPTVDLPAAEDEQNTREGTTAQLAAACGGY